MQTEELNASDNYKKILDKSPLKYGDGHSYRMNKHKI